MAVNVRHGLTEADRKEQRRRALELRTQGANLQAIADDLGVSVATASRRVHAALDTGLQAAVERHRELEGARLDGVLVRLTQILDEPSAKASDKVQALRTVVATVTERRNLFGLTPPVEQYVTVTQVPLDPAVDELLEEMTSRELAAGSERGNVGRSLPASDVFGLPAGGAGARRIEGRVESLLETGTRSLSVAERRRLRRGQEQSHDDR